MNKILKKEPKAPGPTAASSTGFKGKYTYAKEGGVPRAEADVSNYMM